MIYKCEHLYFNEVSVEKVYKVLGVLWDADFDVLTFDLSNFYGNCFLLR